MVSRTENVRQGCGDLWVGGHTGRVGQARAVGSRRPWRVGCSGLRVGPGLPFFWKSGVAARHEGRAPPCRDGSRHPSSRSQAAAGGSRARRSAARKTSIAAGLVTTARTVRRPPQRLQIRRSQSAMCSAAPVVVSVAVATVGASRTKAARPSPASRAVAVGTVFGVALAVSAGPSSCGFALQTAEGAGGRGTTRSRQRWRERALHENARADTSEAARWRQAVPTLRRASSRARSPSRESPS